MPRTGENKKIVDFLIESAAFNIILEDDERSYWRILTELDEDLFAILSSRCETFHNVPNSLEWRCPVLAEFDEGRFRQMLRVTRDHFGVLLSLISNSPQFVNSHTQRQYPIDIQLGVVLYRLGSSGENAAIRKIATMFGIGDGETIYKMTKRVFQSFLSLQHEYISWSDPTERQDIVCKTYHELPHCIGYIDGTELKLPEAPVVNHTSYFSKSRIYSIKAQVVCDYQLQIRHVTVGHFGSVHDARMFRTSSLFTQEDSFFSSEQWIAGDSAYPLRTTVITPFRPNSQQLNLSKRKAFNLRHSRFRVRVEHCFGILKERFGSLKELRIRIKDEQSHNFCSQWFMVCCILHNILRSPLDNIEDNLSSLVQDDSGDQIAPTENYARTTEAVEKRQALYRIMFED